MKHHLYHTGTPAGDERDLHAAIQEIRDDLHSAKKKRKRLKKRGGGKKKLRKLGKRIDRLEEKLERLMWKLQENLSGLCGSCKPCQASALRWVGRKSFCLWQSSMVPVTSRPFASETNTRRRHVSNYPAIICRK